MIRGRLLVEALLIAISGRLATVALDTRKTNAPRFTAAQFAYLV